MTRQRNDTFTGNSARLCASADRERLQNSYLMNGFNDLHVYLDTYDYVCNSWTLVAAQIASHENGS